MPFTPEFRNLVTKYKRKYKELECEYFQIILKNKKMILEFSGLK